MSDEDARAVEAIKAALAESPKRYVVNVTAHWGTPARKQILTIDAALSPTLPAEVILECMQGSARAEILKCGYTQAEADIATLEFEVIEA